MDTTDNFFPTIAKDDGHFTEKSVPTDTSKWDTLHKTLEGSDLPSRSGADSLFTMAWVLGIGLGLIWVLRNGRTVFVQWRENRLRRANRRRHGIPDDDDRPFNIAYAAAAQARRERERADREQVKPATQHEAALEWERHGKPQGLRQRVPAGRPSGFQPPPIQSSPASAAPANEEGYPSTPNRVTFYASHEVHDPYRPAEIYSPNRRAVGTQQRALIPSISQFQHAVPPGHHIYGTHHQTDSKVDSSRLWRKPYIVERDFVNTEDAAPKRHSPSRRDSLQVQKRGFKRHADPEGEQDWEMSQDKRPRKGSLKYSQKESDAEDISMEGASSDLEPRGTKRDRDERDSESEDATDHTDESQEVRPTRKRRANGKVKGKVESPSRGRKRDRSIEASSASEGEETDGRRKRGRKHERKEKAQKSVVNGVASESDELIEFSKDPACGGRKIGEVWEVNGQAFKVGLDGRRLRHALVKQNRTKFPMPKDSSHADAKAKMEVIVEKWLNDEEYKSVKDNFELAWQESSTPSIESKAAEEPPASGGRKRLLWDGPPSSPLKGRASIGVSTLSNPFDSAPSNASRRASAAHAIVNIPVESPKSRQANAFSTWEKQDLEAVSLRKMRARLEKEKKEKEEKEAAAKPVESSKPIATTTPSITPLTSTTNIPSLATASNPLLTKPTFFPLSTSVQPVVPLSTAPDTVKPPTTSTPATTVSLPTMPAATNTAQSVTTTPIPATSPSISFPSSAPSGAISAASKPSAPNPFALPTKATASSAAPATAIPAPFTFSPAAPSTTEQRQPQTAQAPFTGFPSIAKPVITTPSGSLFNPNPTNNQPSTGPAQSNPFTFGVSSATTTPSKPIFDNSLAKAIETKASAIGSATGIQPTAQTTPATPTPAPPTFSFNVKPAEIGLKSGETKPTNAASTPGSNSLLTRLGPPATLGQTSTTPTPFGAGPTVGSADTSKTQGFFFNANPALSSAEKRPSEQNKPVFGVQGTASPFGQSSPQTSTSTPSDSSKAALAPPKITFGAGGASSSPFGYVDTSKSVFGSVSGSSNPFTFNPAPSKNAFGQPASDAPKNISAFGGGTSTPLFGQTGSGPRPFFGATSSEPTKGAFGQPVQMSLSTEPSKVIGNTGTTSSEVGKASLDSGAATGTSSATKPGLTPTFNFNADASSNPQTTSPFNISPGKPAPVFGQTSAFGQAPAFGGFPSTGFGQNTSAGTTPNALGQGSATPSTTTPTFNFGANPEEKK